MMSFFQGQLDYIYFLYGLSFFFLGLVCFLLYKNEKKDLPWHLLALFGVIHGVHEWIEMIQLFFPFSSPWLKFFQISLLTFGFVLLFEFGRKSIKKRKKWFGIWVYLPIVILLFTGWKIGGLEGYIISVRFFLGALGAIFASIAFWIFPFNEKERRLFPSFLTISFWMYALTQIVTSSDLFFQRFGFPIQFVREILATFIFLNIWFRYQFFVVPEKLSRRTSVKSLVQSKGFIFLVLFLFGSIILGYELLHVLENQARKELLAESKDTVELLSSNLQSTMLRARNMSFSLSLFQEIKKDLKEGSTNTDLVNSILDRYQRIIGDSVCYIMNKEGTVIATSNRKDEDSFLGKNYAFRSYFTESMHGDSGTLFALGVTSRRPGFYTSYPVKDANGDILGVAVIKMNLDSIEESLSRFSEVFLVSPEGVIFLSGDPAQKGKSLSLLSDTVKQSILTNKLFGTGTFEPLFQERPKNGMVVIFKNQSYLVLLRPLNGDGWTYVFLRPINLISYYRFFGLVLILFFYIFFAAFVVISQIMKKNAIFSYFASIVYTSQDAIIGKDLMGKILSWNEGAQKIYGYTKEEMIGQSVGLLLTKDQKTKNDRIFHTIQRGESLENFEMKHVHKNGKDVDVSVTISPVRDISGLIVGASMIARDMTRAKELEKTKREFVSIVSHQLRTPLTGIKWFAELLNDSHVGPLLKVQKEYLQQISDSNQRMIRLVNDLLEVSHIEDQSVYKMHFLKEDFSSILRETVDEQLILAKIKKVEIQLSPECLKKIMLPMDRMRFEQVLQNVLDNAIKFSPKGGIISVSCQKQTGQLVCSVQDHGSGIPAHQQSRVFEKFFRADNAVDAGSGTGLGLYIAKSIVEAHHGKIWFESEENKGTTFFISLPLKNDE